MIRKLLGLLTAAAIASAGALVTTPTIAGAAVGDITMYPVPGDPFATPTGIVTGPDGNLWFTNFTGDTIGRIDPADGAVTTFSDPGIVGPGSITVGADGNLWFTNFGSDTIGRIDPDGGTVTTFGHPDVSNPSAITAGPDGNLWIAEGVGDFGRVTLDGTITMFDSPFATFDIAAGPDGNLWFSSFGSSIGRFDPGDATIEVFSDAGVDQANDFAIGPDGNLWFTSLATDRIGRITPAGVITTFVDPAGEIDEPVGITAARDGNLWFTNRLNDRIGRLDPDDGSFVSFADAMNWQGVIHPGGITEGPDGNVWFTSPGNDRIGRIDPVDDPPVALDDAYSTSDATPLVVAAPGVLANDTDPDPSGSGLTAAIATGPTNGSVALAPDGGFTYTSDPGFGGIDSFTYTAGDGVSASAPATVTITVLDHRPDAHVRRAGGAFVGDDIYNDTGAGQSVTDRAPRLGTATYQVRLQNDASAVTDTFTVRGTPSAPRFGVRYFAGSTDVTAAVVAGAYTTPALAPGATHTLIVRVTVGLLAPLGGSHTAAITATSTGNPSRADTVKAITRTL